MKFKTNLVRSFADVEVGTKLENITLISSAIEGKSRWSYQTRQVLEFDGNYYEYSFSSGATEYQCEFSCEDEADTIELNQVFPVYETAYRSAKQLNKA